MGGFALSVRGWLTDCSKGDNLGLYWWLFFRRAQAKHSWTRHVLTFCLNRMAHRHGGYIGNGAVIEGIPTLPHGLHGIYISRYAVLGADCWIYQNVTIGEVQRKAPRIGRNCLIGAGAVLVGDIKIGDSVKIGAGAVVCSDVPGGCTVVAPPARVLPRRCAHDLRQPPGLD